MERKIRKTLPLLTIVLCVLSCGSEESQEFTEKTVRSIKAVQHVRGTLYLGDDDDGVWRLNNKSQSWELIFSDDQPRSFAVHQNTLYVGAWGGIYRLEPNGETFTQITNPDEWTNLPVNALAVVDNTIYAIRRDKLVRSQDGGLKWHPIHPSGDEDTRILSLAVTGNTVYVLTRQHGILRSLDGGNSWATINTGLPKRTIISGATLSSLQFDNTLYLGTDKGVYRLSEDTTWMSVGLNDKSIHLLVATNNALYAVARICGVFASYDGGQFWRYIGFAGVDVQALTVFEDQLYIGTFLEGLFYTINEGQTWHPLNKGLNFRPY